MIDVPDFVLGRDIRKTGKAMQVDASDVFQPMNPGDALIRKYKIIGTAPDNHHWATLDGLELKSKWLQKL